MLREMYIETLPEMRGWDIIKYLTHFQQISNVKKCKQSEWSMRIPSDQRNFFQQNQDLVVVILNILGDKIRVFYPSDDAKIISLTDLLLLPFSEFAIGLFIWFHLMIQYD